MKLEEAIQRLDRAVGVHGSSNSYRIRQKFSNILQEVKYKNLTQEQLTAVEKELDEIFEGLDVESSNAEAALEPKLISFIRNLRRNFSLVPESYWAMYGLKAGLFVGLTIMSLLILYTDSEIKFYVPLCCLLLGFFIGSLFDRRQKSKGKSLLTRMI
ncbi:hypothetical protein [Salinimicrobium oceani]|uniref:Uncharacterized protein n=1 Tax=Salinimicrobium oceani TaxID=2722702 RepID=A0ABX1CY76_9FLAO|nr:hypothetical protein [Salinimicrobium oceani]NJW53225.1 hypothetical protein [Salinimicrobium oceani]